MSDKMRQEAGEIIQYLNDLLAQQAFAVINNRLREIAENAEAHSTMSLIAHLRTVYSFRDILPDWMTLAEVAVRLVYAREDKADSILAGIASEVYEPRRSKSDTIIAHLFFRYRILIEQNESKLEGLPERCSASNLRSLCSEGCVKNRYPFDKLCRWLGFVQGVLAVQGIIDVDKERDYTRPLFHQLYGTNAPSFGD